MSDPDSAPVVIERIRNRVARRCAVGYQSEYDVDTLALCDYWEAVSQAYINLLLQSEQEADR